MNCLIVTAAGISSRFNEDSADDHLKCIYYEKNPEYTLLYHILMQNREYDYIVIVGGYRFHELEEYVRTHLKALRDKIVILENPYYKEYGSGYSLKIGMEACLKKEKIDEIFFTEGDLYIGIKDYQRIKKVRQDCFTYNHEVILAEKAVVIYRTETGWHYAFDSEHKGISMPGKILEIYNSAQMWKFYDIEWLRTIFAEIQEEEWQGTNLILIQKYFNKKEALPVEINTWVNCNTKGDYRKCDWRTEHEVSD